MFVVGTAGHIDHGKSTLIHRLTGTHPDRLREEQERGMTIDLGFASMRLPSNREIGLVDVPGHHRFIRNMLAGIGSINLILFVVDATEGWMPQSQEHLDILDLLHIHRGIVVLTKCDRVDDEWLLMVEDDVRYALQGTGLAQAAILRVSSVTGEGITELIGLMEALLNEDARALNVDRPRLWIDRAFSVRGTGSVVTGTLVGGSLELDQNVRSLPEGLGARIRRLQVHGQEVPLARPGTRVAVNLSSVERGEMRRGDTLVLPNQRATERLNAWFRLLPGNERGLKGLSHCHLYIGSAERVALVRYLGGETLEPGSEGLLQITLDRPVAAEIHDRFILRDQTTQRTIGGGVVVDAEPRAVRRRSLRYSKQGGQAAESAWSRNERLDAKAMAKRVDAPSAQLVELIVAERGCIGKGDLIRQIPARPADVEADIRSLVMGGQLIELATDLIASEAWDAIVSRLMGILHSFHKTYPLRPGPSRESVRSQLGLESRLFDATIHRLVREGRIEALGATVQASDHRQELAPEVTAECHAILEHIAQCGFEGPTCDQLLTLGYDGEVVNWLLTHNQLVRIGGELLYLPRTLDDLRARVSGHIQMHGSISVGNLRDLLQTSRRYALPLLEHLDETNYTRRIGDTRILA